ncbi:MAG: hypothetical protein ACR2IE_02405 [Candidatus Sumerlaeaceae bacterium]
MKCRFVVMITSILVVVPGSIGFLKAAETENVSALDKAALPAKKSRPASTKVQSPQKPSPATATKAATAGVAAAAAATPAVLNLGAVRPGNLVLPQLAIQFAGGDIANRVQFDLTLADIAIAPLQNDAAAAAAEKDRQQGTGVDYDGWTVANVSYVLRGVLAEGSAQAELFDIASRRRVFGQSYTGPATQDQVSLAHRIADDVIHAITGQTGIFSSQIAYLGDFNGGIKEVMVIDADGQRARQLTNERSLVASPAWGRVGQEVFFTSYRENNPDLYGITLDGRRFQVSRRPGLNTAPSWSDAAQRLAVALSKDGNSEIYTMGPDGRNLARLTRTGADVSDTSPDWNADGTQISYTSDDTGQPGIYVMNADGSGNRRITSGGYFDSVSWSPDGKRLAYVAREGGAFNVYMLDLSTNAPVRLTQNQGDNTDPCWGPDSRHLVFASTRGTGRNIYMMHTDTRVAKPLTRGGNCSSPVWGPARKQ